ncbi:adenine phosphoribosyltransferase [bacterium]|nr:adenine phosphoribosyltransferase [bacterium]
MDALKELIRDIPDFPRKGIVFKDITPLLQDADGFNTVIRELYKRYKNTPIDYVAGIESRGFIIGAALAYKLRTGFTIIRKKGKLPYKTLSARYDLEYGSDELEMHIDAVGGNDRILLVDDLLATGGTLQAVAKMITDTGACIVDIAVVIELTFLNGREKLHPYPVHSLLQY